MNTDTATIATIEIRLNGQALRWPAQLSLAELVAQQGKTEVQVATAVNGQFVPRAQRAEHVLQANDEVTFFQPIAGG